MTTDDPTREVQPVTLVQYRVEMLKKLEAERATARAWTDAHYDLERDSTPFEFTDADGRRLRADAWRAEHLQRLEFFRAREHASIDAHFDRWRDQLERSLEALWERCEEGPLH